VDAIETHNDAPLPLFQFCIRKKYVLRAELVTTMCAPNTS